MPSSISPSEEDMCRCGEAAAVCKGKGVADRSRIIKVAGLSFIGSFVRHPLSLIESPAVPIFGRLRDSAEHSRAHWSAGCEAAKDVLVHRRR
jgi:hypothetical protein